MLQSESAGIERKKKHEGKTEEKPKNKWYMGVYGGESESEIYLSSWLCYFGRIEVTSWVYGMEWHSDSRQLLSC